MIRTPFPKWWTIQKKWWILKFLTIKLHSIAISLTLTSREMMKWNEKLNIYDCQSIICEWLYLSIGFD